MGRFVDDEEAVELAVVSWSEELEARGGVVEDGSLALAALAFAMLSLRCARIWCLLLAPIISSPGGNEELVASCKSRTRLGS